MMRIIIVVIAALVFALVNAAPLDKEFADFKMKFGRVYSSIEEESRRQSIFTENIKTRLPEMARRNPNAIFGVTQFSDLTAEEFTASMGVPTRVQPRHRTGLIPPSARRPVPPAVNWVEKGAVSPVQDQGQCGNSALFATIYNIEGANFVSKRKLIALSEEELKVCVSGGCNGGLAAGFYDWLLNNTNGTVATAASWPPSPTPKCNWKDHTVGAQFDRLIRISHSEKVMTVETWKTGPIFVAVAAQSWQMYEGGVLSDCTGEVNHAATIVGYNETATPPYWLIKNSWGPAWGEAGYIRILKGKDVCKITTLPLTVHIV